MTDVFRVRLNCVDYYQAPPTDLDPPLWGTLSRSAQHTLPQVPVIRVFGATETGQKVCAHIRGAFPYLYLEYGGSLARADVDAYIDTLRLSIDHALAVSYRRDPYDGKAVFVAHISLVKGVPYFGYHVGYRYFLKVYLLNPNNMTRLTDLLHQGAIMKRTFQPYESHLQYLLQWMCDFNLYGCAYIETAKPHFRGPIPQYLDLNSLIHQWHDRSITPSQMLDPDLFPRQSHCSLEVDICVQDILNRADIHPRPLHHDFIERFNHLAPDEKLVQSMAGLWRDETRRRKLRMGITDPSSSPFPPEVLVSMSADPRNTDKGGWIHEDEFRETVERLARDERERMGGARVEFETFVKARAEAEEFEVQTTFESVGELFPDRLRQAQADKQIKDEDYGHGHGHGKSTQAIVDESSIFASKLQDDAEESDEEAAREKAVTQGQSNRLVGSVAVHRDRRGENGADAEQIEVQHYADQPIDQQDESTRNATLLAEAAQVAKRSLDISALQSDAAAAGHTSHKRQLSNDDDSVKRRKVVAFDESPQQRPPSRRFRVKDCTTGSQLLAAIDKTEDESLLHNPPPASTQAPSSPVTQRHERPGVLAFPVVKNPQDPDTQFRLSQRDDLPGRRTHLTPVKSTPPKSSPPVSSQSLRKTTWSATKSSDATITTPSKEIQISPAAMRMARKYGQQFPTTEGSQTMVFAPPPPSSADIIATMRAECDCDVVYQDAYYSDEKDVPERVREYAGQEFKLESTTVPYLPDFDPTAQSAASKGWKTPIVVDKAKEALDHQRRARQCQLRAWEIEARPPSYAEVEEWMKQDCPEAVDTEAAEGQVQQPASQIKRKNRPAAELSQIEGPTQKNKHGFKFSQKKKSTSVRHETQYMTTMSVEVHVNSRSDLAPDPEHDEISCIFWCLQSDDDGLVSNVDDDGKRVGILVLSADEHFTRKICKQVSVEVEEEDNELDLINRLVDIVRNYDPDILTGYEVHNSSWGYLIERARLKFEYNLCDEFSRMKSLSHGRFGKDADRWGFNNTSTIRITGRHMINIWRAMRSELNLLQYTMENVVFHLLHRRIPHYSFTDLTYWYKSPRPRDLAKLLDHFITRVQLDLEILDANELIPRTSEQARLLGVDFFSVFSRGSQFKVESLMFRIAKPESFVLVSPSRKQVGQQNALECLPLVMEPQSAFYSSPLLVLDFQSLYPSVMIAYNYCYSTCLGRIVSWRGQNKMGFSDFKRDLGLLELVKDKLNIAPNGMMYVKPEMRKSLLAKMLGEILETRVMVKSGMKVDKDDKTLQQLLNNRQLALKLIANVTYGYTSASFSGRMPCSEIADSIVQTGRETLEKAIALIHSVSRWGAEVVYGDTDSLFVYLKGRTRDQAFDIGNEIAKAVTDMNPRPVKLKFEKVYHPCVLLAKKRYVGFKYEHRHQATPDFDAKGIETVRRDGTPAEQKIEEAALKMLFRTADLSPIKSYLQAQWTKILRGKFSVQDFCFAKEVKLGTYSDKGVAPAGALIATKRMLRDPRLEPQYGERVPYVVIAGGPQAKLYEKCVEPERLIYDETAELDAEYYITKNLIPPLERIFNLVGANVRAWYDEMPKVQRVRSVGGGGAADAGRPEVYARRTMESYMATSSCVVCRSKLTSPPSTSTDPPLPLCPRCAVNTANTLLTLRRKLQKAQSRKAELESVCRSCAGLAPGDEVRCASRDCPVFYSRVKAQTRARAQERRLGGVVAEVERRALRDEGLEW